MKNLGGIFPVKVMILTFFGDIVQFKILIVVWYRFSVTIVNVMI